MGTPVQVDEGRRHVYLIIIFLEISFLEPENFFNVLFKCVHCRTHLTLFVHKRSGGTEMAGMCDDGTSI